MVDVEIITETEPAKDIHLFAYVNSPGRNHRAALEPIKKFSSLIRTVALPSAIAPRTRIPDSLTTHSGWKSNSFKRGKMCGRSSSRNTLARTSRAAAEHFPEGN